MRCSRAPVLLLLPPFHGTSPTSDALTRAIPGMTLYPSRRRCHALRGQADANHLAPALKPWPHSLTSICLAMTRHPALLIPFPPSLSASQPAGFETLVQCLVQIGGIRDAKVRSAFITHTLSPALTLFHTPVQTRAHTHSRAHVHSCTPAHSCTRIQTCLGYSQMYSHVYGLVHTLNGTLNNTQTDTHTHTHTHPHPLINFT
jgi:hypothetical protein